MAQMERALGAFEAYESKNLQVEARCCVNVRNRNAGCTACLDACPVGAIACEKNELTVSWSTCVSCEACVAACPTEVFRSVNHPSEMLAERAREAAAAADGLVTVVCRPLMAKVEALVDTAKIVAVPCLARVDAALLTRIAAVGANGIALVHDDCETCVCRGVGRQADAAVSAASELVSALGGSCRIASRAKLPSAVRRQDEAAFDESRRTFFSGMRQEMQQVADIAASAAVAEVLGDETPEEGPEKVREDGTLPYVQVRRLENLLAAVDELAQAGGPSETTLAKGLFGRLSIDKDRCTGCRMCATFCPTGALRPFELADGRMGVKHMPALCVSCGCCEYICPAEALKVHAAAKAGDIVARKSFAYYMVHPDVTYNRPDTMYRKVQPLFDTDQLYDMQH